MARILRHPHFSSVAVPVMPLLVRYSVCVDQSITENLLLLQNITVWRDNNTGDRAFNNTVAIFFLTLPSTITTYPKNRPFWISRLSFFDLYKSSILLECFKSTVNTLPLIKHCLCFTMVIQAPKNAVIQAPRSTKIDSQTFIVTKLTVFESLFLSDSFILDCLVERNRHIAIFPCISDFCSH